MYLTGDSLCQVRNQPRVPVKKLSVTSATGCFCHLVNPNLETLPIGVYREGTVFNPMQHFLECSLQWDAPRIGRHVNKTVTRAAVVSTSLLQCWTANCLSDLGLDPRRQPRLRRQTCCPNRLIRRCRLIRAGPSVVAKKLPEKGYMEIFS